MNLRDERRRADLTVALLSALSGVSVETIQQVEAGAIRPSDFTAASLTYAIQRVCVPPNPRGVYRRREKVPA